MLYMKVKPEADQFVIDNKFNILIANELYTIKEFEKLRYNFMKNGGSTQQLKNKFELVEVSKKQVFWFFGARFSNDIGVDLPF